MAPFKKKAETRLAEARAALSDTSRQIGVIEAQRAKAILDEDDTAARKLDAQLEELRRDARIGADRVRLLEQQAKEEEHAAILRRRQDHVLRFQKKLQNADEIADELKPASRSPTRYSASSFNCARMRASHGGVPRRTKWRSQLVPMAAR